MISVRIENLTKRFGETVALQALSLSIEPGQIYFLLGPSGCGKTTLLRSIAGFYIPDEGRIFFGDDDVTQLPPHQRNTGMMFQSYALWPHMTVGQNVAFGLEERKVSKPEIERRVHEALASARMEAFKDRRIHQLSGGQQQRVALARALVVRPRCLLLDEPLSNLDTKLRIEMRGEIRRICKEAGLTAIYVTHDQKEALSVGDCIAVMESGHIRQTGPPAEVYRRPKTRFVADFMGETNLIDGTVTEVNDQAIEVDTRIRRFYCVAHGWKPSEGQAVHLSIRPESWQLGADPNAMNAVAGRIQERVYLGEMAQYRFATTGGEMLKIYELNPRFAFSNEASILHASVAEEDVVVVPKE